MEPSEITGTYTYRSFLNEPEIVGDFNKLQFAEAELTLVATLEGKIAGLLSWQTKEDDSERAVMNIEGQISSRSPRLITLHGTGAHGSDIEAFDYVYELSPARRWPQSTNPRLCLVGSVMRAKDHGSAKSGATASVIAVQRDFLEPRDIAGVTLAPTSIAMLASKWHRLWHATWHTVRNEWPNFANERTRQQIRELGWEVNRPPRKKREDGGTLILDNGAGEDFLFMHRWMIKLVQEDYRGQGLTPPASWKQLPDPDVAQVVYSPQTNSAGTVVFKKDAGRSGNMVPSRGEWVNTPDYFLSLMHQWETTYTSPAVLASLSLGALGNLIEFTIHNAMHNRWYTPARDPATGELILDPSTGQPGERPTFDFSDKWNSPKYDYLGEFYSSHVNPVFWRLHGWVDDRIEDWYRAQESSRPGTIKRIHLQGAEWFEISAPWVVVDNPFVGASLHSAAQHLGEYHGRTHEDGHEHDGHHDRQAAEIETMLKVMAAIQRDDAQAHELSLKSLGKGAHRRVTMRFESPERL